MKKFLCCILGVLVLLGMLGGCKRQQEAPQDTPPTGVEASEAAGPYRIGLVQCGEYGPLNAAREAVMSRLDEWGYDEARVELNYQNAGDDEKKASEICKGFARDKMDMIIAVGLPAAKAASDAVGSGGSIKVLFAGVNDPGSQLNIKNLSAPERGVTGVSDRVSGEQTVGLIQQMKPDVHSIGLLYSAADENAADAAKAVQDYCRKVGIDTQVATAMSTEGAQKAAEDLCAQTDVVFAPGDSVIAAAGAQVAQVCAQENKLWLAGSEALVQSGALACLSADYEELGNRTADMAVQVITGTQVSQLPVAFFDSWQVWINQSTLEKQKLELPEDLMNSAHYMVQN